MISRNGLTFGNTLVLHVAGRQMAGLAGSFAALLTRDAYSGDVLQQWIMAARAADLPHVHAFTSGLDLDIQAATAALTLPHHNGRTEAVNTRTKVPRGRRVGLTGAVGSGAEQAVHGLGRREAGRRVTEGRRYSWPSGQRLLA